MLKRKIGDKVNINPYSNITGEIIDSKEVTQPFHPSWDYVVKFDCPVNMGCGIQEQEYYNDDELDRLERNWNMLKNYKKKSY